MIRQMEEEVLLQYQSQYASITPFTPVELPDFAVITGVNGSGKSHLLEAISRKNVQIEGCENSRIVLFNYENFRLDNEPFFNGHQLAAERESAWQYHEQHIKPNVSNWRNSLGTNYQPIKEKAITEKKSFWSVGGDLIKQYKDNFRNFMNSENYKANHQAQGIYSLARRTPYSLDEINHDEFVQRYRPFTFKNDFLPVQLGKVFWDYYVKYRSNQVNQYKNEKNGKNYSVLSEKDFLDQHGEKPWELANRILKAFDTLTYKFGSPEGSDIFGNYKLELIHTEKPDLIVEFDKLSSGERTLMALVASIYKASSDDVFPDVLLLDEIDASLHPSMIKNMLSVIHDVFLPEAVKVILITHSPTTIALSPEESIFVMSSSGTNRIEKKSQKEALSILTQGYATIDEGLRFFDEIAKSDLTIITEGYNTRFILKALELNGIYGVDVLQGIEGASGKNQLKTLFDFFSKMDHKNKVLFVFDCDVSYHLEPCGNTFHFTFARNPENSIAVSGIENLFDSSLFDGFTTTISSPDGIETRKLHVPSKRKFEQRIITRNNKSIFQTLTR